VHQLDAELGQIVVAMDQRVVAAEAAQIEVGEEAGCVLLIDLHEGDVELG
jgi:hypothetical protein